MDQVYRVRARRSQNRYRNKGPVLVKDLTDHTVSNVRRPVVIYHESQRPHTRQAWTPRIGDLSRGLAVIVHNVVHEHDGVTLR